MKSDEGAEGEEAEDDDWDMDDVPPLEDNLDDLDSKPQFSSESETPVSDDSDVGEVQPQVEEAKYALIEDQ